MPLPKFTDLIPIEAPEQRPEISEMNFESDNAPKPGALESVAKGVVEQLPTAGALVGGALGATSASVPTMGLGAPGGAAVGAAFGGAAGTAVENAIKGMFWPEEAPKSVRDALAKTGVGAVQGASTEAGGQVVGKLIGATIKGGAEALDDLGDIISSKVIPNISKYADRMGGIEKIKELGKLLNDQGVTNIPGTLNQVGKRLSKVFSATGKALSDTYKNLDKSTQSPITGQQTIEAVKAKVNELVASGAVKGMKKLGDSEQAAVVDALTNFIKPKQLVSHSELNDVAGTLSNTMYNKLNPEIGTIKQLTGRALRAVNTEIALASGASPELVSQLRGISSSYNKLATANSAIQAQLKKNPSRFTQMLEVFAGVGAHTMFGAPGAAVAGAAKLASTSVGKTSATAAAKFGAELLRHGPKLGSYGKMLARVAANKGFEAVMERHAYLQLNDAKYRSLIDDIAPIDVESE